MPETHPETVELFTKSPPPFYGAAGMTVLLIEPGHVRVALPIRPEVGGLRPGVITGPWLAGMIDGVSGLTVQSTRTADDPPLRAVSTVDLSITFLAAATTDVTAEGRLLRAGRSLAFVEVTISDASGAAVVIARATMSVVRGE